MRLATFLESLPPSVRERTELRPLRYHLGLDTADAARDAYHQTLARNLRALARLDEILDAARARGVQLLPYKGALLARDHYPDPGTRPMADLDLLVRPAQLDAAVTTLHALGFAPARPDTARFSADFAHDVALTDGVVYVELHFALFHELELDGELESVFARARPEGPHLDDHLMILALHAATHAYADSPIWLVDVVLLLAAGADRDRAAQLASSRRGGRAFAVAMLLFDVPRLSARWMRHAPGRVRSLLARAALVEGPLRRARWFGRKLWLTARERF